MKNSLYWLTLIWLRFWARIVLRRVKPYIIGVTGSAGKSSAVAAMEPVIKLKFPRLKVARKANSESGIPADILGLHFGESSWPVLDWARILILAPLRAAYSLLPTLYSPFDCYLVEMGVDEPTQPKNMEYLLTILQPDAGVILNALSVHTEQFGSVAKIAEEKGKLVTENSNLKFAILNADQLEINSLLISSGLPRGVKTLTFGKNSKADIRILSIKPSLEGTEIALQYGAPRLKPWCHKKPSFAKASEGYPPHYMEATSAEADSGIHPRVNPWFSAKADNKQKYFIKLNRLVLPDFYGYTFAAAFATGISVGLEPPDIIKAVSSDFVLPAGRGQIFNGVKDAIIIDSSYNASGETMVGSLQLLKTAAGKRRKIAILGDMRELGRQAEKEHLTVAETILGTADQALLVGPLMRQFVLPHLEKHNFLAQWFSTAGQAARFLPKLRGNEVILVKGSQNTIFLEIVVEALLSNKEDVKKLCRRGKFWDRQRRPYI